MIVCVKPQAPGEPAAASVLASEWRLLMIAGLDSFEPFDGFVKHGEAEQGRNEKQQNSSHCIDQVGC